MMEPLTRRDDDCWECIAEEIGTTDPDLAEQLREALGHPRRDVSSAALALVMTSYRVQVETAATICRALLRCTH